MRNLSTELGEGGAQRPLTYGVAQAATLLGVSNTSIYRLLKMKKLRALKALRTKRITGKSIDEFLDDDDDDQP